MVLSYAIVLKENAATVWYRGGDRELHCLDHEGAEFFPYEPKSLGRWLENVCRLGSLNGCEADFLVLSAEGTAPFSLEVVNAELHPSPKTDWSAHDAQMLVHRLFPDDEVTLDYGEVRETIQPSTIMRGRSLFYVTLTASVPLPDVQVPPIDDRGDSLVAVWAKGNTERAELCRQRSASVYNR